MRELLEWVRQNRRFVLVVTLIALALRLFFVWRYPHVAGDSLVYGDTAQNLLSHHIYGVTDDGAVRPTLIRLPGYAGFLALVFAICGAGHFTPALVLQAFIDTNTCLVIAALALELMGARAARAAFLLAAVCPFTANYTAVALSETLAIFTVAHALYYGVRGIRTLQSGRPAFGLWLLAGLWSAASIYMRPDNALAALALGLGLLILLFRPGMRKSAITAGVTLTMAALLPLVPWTVRNWRTFHLFQPLAARYANDPGEYAPLGTLRWERTWVTEYSSVDNFLWHMDGEPLDIHALPERAFDSREQFDTTARLLDSYNQKLYVDPALDAEFERLAEERILDNPFRYFVWLPFLRVSDMWLRPRTEMLPIEVEWWKFEDWGESLFALFWGAVNAVFLVLAVRGWWKWKWRLGIAGLVLVLFVVLRSSFLGSIENPEPRYVLECYPVVLALAAGGIMRSRQECRLRT